MGRPQEEMTKLLGTRDRRGCGLAEEQEENRERTGNKEKAGGGGSWGVQRLRPMRGSRVEDGVKDMQKSESEILAG